MNVVKSASASDIKSAKYVFETTGIRDYFLLTKGWHYAFSNVGKVYPRSFVEQFLSNRKDADTIIIEGGYDMKPESTPNQRTITLVTIPQEVAQLIRNMRTAIYTDAEIIRCATSKDGIEVYREGLSSIPFDTLLSALVNGFTIEKSAEELAHDAIRAEFIKRWSPGHNSEDVAFARGMRHTLDVLSISITEVNA